METHIFCGMKIIIFYMLYLHCYTLNHAHAADYHFYIITYKDICITAV